MIVAFVIPFKEFLAHLLVLMKCMIMPRLQLALLSLAMQLYCHATGFQ